MTYKVQDVPSEFAALAVALEVVTDRGIIRFGPGAVLGAAKRGCLAIIPQRGIMVWKRRQGSREVSQLVEDFDGRPAAGKAAPVAFPDDWEYAGAAVSILYESDKRNGGGKGRRSLYRHEFSPGAEAYRAPGGWCVVVGEKIRVEDRGIVH